MDRINYIDINRYLLLTLLLLRLRPFIGFIIVTEDSFRAICIGATTLQKAIQTTILVFHKCSEQLHLLGKILLFHIAFIRL